MSGQQKVAKEWPTLDAAALVETRDALHAYAKIAGAWAAACRPRRKHWWHASLRPSLTGVTTGIVYTPTLQFEIALNFRASQLLVSTATGKALSVGLRGQAAKDIAGEVSHFLHEAGMAEETADAVANAKGTQDTAVFDGYSAAIAGGLGQALAAVTDVLGAFRAGIREETSPIQVWPHHFDLAMLWLPGTKIEGEDPEDEEQADKQMNFGFTFGDSSIAEPYFYVTAYPSPSELADLRLPEGVTWLSDGFTGAVLTYERLRKAAQPDEYLSQLWTRMLTEGEQHLK